ncbi:hypothetical protein V8F06_009051 [Rhypophila decipiens]
MFPEDHCPPIFSEERNTGIGTLGINAIHSDTLPMNITRTVYKSSKPQVVNVCHLPPPPSSFNVTISNSTEGLREAAVMMSAFIANVSHLNRRCQEEKGSSPKSRRRSRRDRPSRTSYLIYPEKRYTRQPQQYQYHGSSSTALARCMGPESDQYLEPFGSDLEVRESDQYLNPIGLYLEVQESDQYLEPIRSSLEVQDGQDGLPESAQTIVVDSSDSRCSHGNLKWFPPWRRKKGQCPQCASLEKKSWVGKQAQDLAGTVEEERRDNSVRRSLRTRLNSI